jgi:hypothetical protein
MCGKQRTLSAVFLDVWQIKELRAHFADVWQRKDLEEGGSRGQEREPKVGKSEGLNVEKKWQVAGQGKGRSGEDGIGDTRERIAESSIIVNIFVYYHSNGAGRC